MSFCVYNLLIELLVDIALHEDFKTTILFHEIGHYLDFIAHEGETIRFLKGHLTSQECHLRAQRTELAAFTHSLTKLLKLAEGGWQLPLRNTLNRIIQRSISDSDLDYKIAITRLMENQLWKDCKKQQESESDPGE